MIVKGMSEFSDLEKYELTEVSVGWIRSLNLSVYKLGKRLSTAS